MSCGVGHRCGSVLVLLWLWCRPVATAPIGPLAWGPKKARKKKKKELRYRIHETKVKLSLFALGTCVYVDLFACRLLPPAFFMALPLILFKSHYHWRLILKEHLSSSLVLFSFVLFIFFLYLICNNVYLSASFIANNLSVYHYIFGIWKIFQQVFIKSPNELI